MKFEDLKFEKWRKEPSYWMPWERLVLGKRASVNFDNGYVVSVIFGHEDDDSYSNGVDTYEVAVLNSFTDDALEGFGEVGELASKVAKKIRKQEACIEHNELAFVNADENENFDKELILEAGDIAWQLAGLCKVMGWNLEEVCQANIDKLQARKQAGTIDGNGDGIYNR